MINVHILYDMIFNYLIELKINEIRGKKRNLTIKEVKTSKANTDISSFIQKFLNFIGIKYMRKNIMFFLCYKFAKNNLKNN